MILRRLSLKGFLSFREQREIVFGDASVWMLSGPNGSGKSSVFDALTYALFTAHRGGKQNAEELINKDSDGFLIEIDMELGPSLYRVRRTLTKGGKSTRQVLRHEPSLSPEMDGVWSAVPGTERDDGFKLWVRENVGLSFESFTSSVLLTQGGAERLISSTPVDRLVVLKGIVGLDRYEKLQKRVDDRRKSLDADAAAARRRLDALTDPGDEARAAAWAEVATRESAREAAVGEAERLATLSHLAARWAEIQAEAKGIRDRLERDRLVIAEADAIACDRDRLIELRSVVPMLEAAFAHRQALVAAESKAGRLDADRAVIEAQVREARERLSTVRERLAELRKTIDADAVGERALGERLREIAALVGRLDVYEAQVKAVARIEAQIAAEPAGDDLDAALAERDRIEALGLCLPALERLARATEDLNTSTIAKQEAAKQEDEALVSGPVIKAEFTQLSAQVEHAATVLRESEARVVTARTMLAVANGRREKADALAEAPSCDHCGQPLTPEHLARERARRAGEVRVAESEMAEADRQARDTARDERALRSRLEETTKRLDDARDRLKTGRRARLDAEAKIAIAQSARDSAVAELPGSMQVQAAADPAQVLASCRAESKRLPAARQRVAKAEEARRTRDSLRDKLRSAVELREAQAAQLPARPEGLRDEKARLEAGHAEMAARANRNREDRDRAEAGLADLARSIEAAESQLSRIAQEASGVAARRESAAAAVARAVAALPETWRETAADAPDPFASELKALEARGIEAKAESLRVARSELGHLQARRDDLERQAEAIPEDARFPRETIAARLAAARRASNDAESAAHAARHEAERLDRIRAERATVAEEMLALEGQAATAAALAKLLGPRGLQRHLVRRAEKEIVRFANERLDRLSGGALSLRLRPRAEGETDETALDLEAHDRRTRRSVAVAFLSGSQRFRVAVALALAIGRLAATNSRPIESVIIDEGFGCLDREGRQVMIQELRNLGKGVRRVLLVSHQEEFADAFPDGCRFSLEEGATVVGPLSSGL